MHLQFFTPDSFACKPEQPISSLPCPLHGLCQTAIWATVFKEFFAHITSPILALIDVDLWRKLCHFVRRQARHQARVKLFCIELQRSIVGLVCCRVLFRKAFRQQCWPFSLTNPLPLSGFWIKRQHEYFWGMFIVYLCVCPPCCVLCSSCCSQTFFSKLLKPSQTSWAHTDIIYLLGSNWRQPVI